MNNRDLLGLGIRNLLRRRTRTFLAIIGVVIGTAAIVVMLSIGFGLSAAYQAQIESYGNLRVIDVYRGWGGPSGGEEAVLDDKAIAAIEKIKGVEAVSPKVDMYLSFGIGKYIAQSSVIGIKPEMMEKLGYEIGEGRLLQPGDKFAVVFGNQVPSWFYNPKKTWGSSWGGEAQVDVVTDKLIITADEYYGMKRPQGEGGSADKINYKEYKAKGVGILANAEDYQTAYNAYMPLETLELIKEETAKARKETPSRQQKKSYDSGMVYVGNIDDVKEVSEAIREMGFQTNSLNDWLESMQKTARMIQGVLGGIGGISLFVAALGITNTMIMSIYERTKEIGVMKVIGANLVDIKRMFLLEAGMIGLGGGILGVVLSYVLSFLMNTVLGSVMSMALGLGGDGSAVSVIPWWLAVSALVFATAIGIISGYSPARRAMRLSALESLRNE